MTRVKLRKSYALRGAVAAIAAAAFTAPAMAQVNVTASDVNMLNLLSPFLNLPNTTVGQNTLTDNLTNSIAVNNWASTQPVVEAVSISDKLIMSGSSTALGSAAVAGQSNTLSFIVAANYGPASNLAGGSPVQTPQSVGGVSPSQPYGGLGNLGAAYQNAVAPGTSNTALVNLLTSAYSFTSQDLGVAKHYFANGAATNPSVTPPNYTPVAAVAPAGYTLPTNKGLPNTSPQGSVYDLAYGVKNTDVNQDTYGDSRPVQVKPSAINGYDPTALTGLATNPSFPSGHTTYAFTDSILIGMMSPQFFQSMILRASEYGNSRIDLGVHYALDIIASRSFVQFDLAQMLNATSGGNALTNPYYYQNTVANATATNPSTLTALNLNGQFVLAAPQLNAALNGSTGSCGGSLAACATNNPYNSYSASTYSNQGANNSAIYQYRLTYGLPTLSFTQAPRELTDTQGNSAAILLATLYGGQGSPQAQALANAVTGSNAGIYANLTTGTINQIIANTETQALAAFYGTQLSYWSRIDLYDAAGYFSNVTGTLTLASTDLVNTDVTVSKTGILAGSGAINGNVTFQQGGALGIQGNGAAGPNGYKGLNATSANFIAGSQIDVLGGAFLPGKTYTILTTTGPIVVNGAASNGTVNQLIVPVNTLTSGNLMQFMSGQLLVEGDPTLQVTFTAKFNGAAVTNNQNAIATAIDTAANGGAYGAQGATLLANLIANNNAATAPGAFNQLSGEGISGQQQTALNAGNLFVTTVLGQATYWADERSNDIFGMKDGPVCSLKDGYDCAIAGRARFWAAGFGGYAELDGQSSTGSASLQSHNSGVAAGVDYEVTRTLLVGLAGGYSDSSFSVSDRATSGTVEGGHFGVYGRENLGAFYVAGAVEYAHYNNTTDRLVTALGGIEEEKGRFTSDEWLARFEGGYRYRYDAVNVTPFAGFEVGSLSNGAFREFSTGVAGLNVAGQSIDTDKTFLGLQLDTKFTNAAGWTISPYVRLSWEHEFNTTRGITASLQALPANFTVYGSAAAADLARVNTGFKTDITKDVSLFASFDGQFSDRGNSYAGTGGLKIRF